MNHKYWSPPHEDFGSRKVSRAIEDIWSSWKIYQEIDEYTIPQETLDYLSERNTDKIEFIVHPGFWEYGYIDAASNFGDQLTAETKALNHENYLEELSQRVYNAVNKNHPIFALDPSQTQDEKTEAFMEDSLGLSDEDYQILETGSGDGIISQGDYGKLFAIFEQDSFEANISGEINGLCPVQFESTLASLSEATEILNADIAEGKKFPDKKVRNIGTLSETEWKFMDNIDYERARHSFESFLITELPKDMGSPEEKEYLTLDAPMRSSGRYTKK